MKCHIELQALCSAEVYPEYFTENGQMSRRTYRKIFGKSLNDAEYECVKRVHWPCSCRSVLLLWLMPWLQIL